jgi:hypothetical protein
MAKSTLTDLVNELNNGTPDYLKVSINDFKKCTKEDRTQMCEWLDAERGIKPVVEQIEQTA